MKKIQTRAVAVTLSGVSFLSSVYAYWLSLNVGLNSGSYSCNNVQKIQIECLESGFLPDVLLIMAGALFLGSVSILFKIYSADIKLRVKSIKFSSLFVPLALVVSSFGLIPQEGCLGWGGCYTFYAFTPLMLMFTCLYIAIIHAQALIAPNMKMLMRSTIYTLSIVIFLSFFWNFFPFFS